MMREDSSPRISAVSKIIKGWISLMKGTLEVPEAFKGADWIHHYINRHLLVFFAT